MKCATREPATRSGLHNAKAANAGKSSLATIYVILCFKSPRVLRPHRQVIRPRSPLLPPRERT
eukprot:7043266-Pyramimonas_sp.AAC.1